MHGTGTVTTATIQAEIQKGIFVPHEYLTNMAMMYFQNASEYVAKSVFPICPVQLSAGKYFTFSKADLLRDNMSRKPQFGKVEPAQMGQLDGSYSCGVDQIIVGIDQISTLNYQRQRGPAMANPRNAKIRFIAEQMNLHQDLVFSQNFFKAGIWKNEWSGSTTYEKGNKKFIKFTDGNSDPILLFDDLCTEVKQNTGRRPNKLVLGQLTYNALKKHPGIVERVKFGGSSANPATVNERVLAELFGMKEVKVCSSIYNASQVGSAEDMHFICEPTSALLAYAPDTPSIEEPSAGYIFTWDMLGNGSYTPVLQWPGENGTHSEFIEGLFSADMKKTSDDLAVFLKECV